MSPYKVVVQHLPQHKDLKAQAQASL